MLADLLNSVFPPELIDSLAALLVFIFFLATLASSIVQLLKTSGKISDGQAGKWNTAISYALIFLTFLITQVFGLGEDVFQDVEALVAAIMAIITSGFVTAIGGKLFYLIALFIGLFTRREEGEGPPPAAVRPAPVAVERPAAG